MKNQNFAIGALFILLFLFPFPLKAEEKSESDRRPYIQQQMVLMGLYVYGIQQELANVRPDTDELFFLADSILAIAEEIDKTKLSPNQHANLDQMLKVVKDLRRTSIAKPKQAKQLAQEVINSCGSCHASAIIDWKIAK